MRLMKRARVAGDRLTSTSPSHPARSCGSTLRMSLWPTSAACRPLHGLNSIFAVSTRLKPGAIDLVPPTAAESLQAPVLGAARHGVERSAAQSVRRECPNSRRALIPNGLKLTSYCHPEPRRRRRIWCKTAGMPQRSFAVYAAQDDSLSDTALTSNRWG